MKRSFLYITLGLVLSLAWITAAGAAASKEEKQLQTAESRVNKDAGEPSGQKTVVERLEKQFNVDEARINGLRAQKLGYGEIAILLSFAQKMPGGITDANVQNVLSMRQGPPVMGWGQIAQKLGTKLGPVVSQVEKVGKESRAAGGSEHLKLEKGEMGEKMEKGEKPEKPMKPEKMEKPDMPEGMGRH